MSIEIDIYSPRTMLEAIKRMPPANTFFRSKFFAAEKFFSTERVDIDMKKGNLICAPYVSRRIGGKVIANTGYETKSYTAPLLAPEKVTTIDDILKRQPGEALYGGLTPGDRAIDKMIEDFAELNDIITRREEQMCAQIMTTGKLEIIGEDVNEVIDFGLTNKETLAAAKRWSASGSDPLADLERWADAVSEKSFVNPDIVVMSPDAARAFLDNEKVQKMLDIRNFHLGSIAPAELSPGVSYLGTLADKNLSIYKYSGKYKNNWTNPENPTVEAFMPSGTVIVASTSAKYVTLYGAVGILDEAGKTIGVVEGKRVPDTYVARKPIRRFLTVSSCPLPVPAEVDSWYVAKVI